MKKYKNILLGLAGALAVSACSSVEEAPEAPVANGDVTVNVVTGDVLHSRALGNVDGYTLNCVMQLLDQNGATVGTQAVVEAAAGTANFVIKHADITAGATNAIFWAEYVPNEVSGKKVYDSSDLTNITYQTTEFDLADANLMKAADAFAGKLTAIKATNTVTLTRPVSQVNFTPANPAVVAGATKLVVTYEATSAYNVATSNCKVDAAGSQALTLTNNSFTETAAPWFSSFIIMPANLTTFDRVINMAVTTPAGERQFKIEADKIPADPNYIVNVTGELSDEQDYVVDVTVNGDYVNEPEPEQPEQPAEFKVGAYVKADGTATTKVDEAVGVVFATEPIAGDVPANYPAAFAGKTIKGYVVALENTSAGVKNLCLTAGTFPTNITENRDITNGTQYTATLFAAFGADSELVKAYNAWVAGKALTGDNVSGWYVGTGVQLEIWGQLIAETKLFSDGSQTVGPTGTPEFIALFPKEKLVDGSKENRKYLSCSINAGGRPSGMDINVSTVPYTAKFAQFSSDTQPAYVRAMFTVFE